MPIITTYKIMHFVSIKISKLWYEVKLMILINSMSKILGVSFLNKLIKEYILLLLEKYFSIRDLDNLEIEGKIVSKIILSKNDYDIGILF